MKEQMKLVAAAFAAATVAAPAPALAQSSVTISGRVDMGAVYIDNGVTKQKRVDSGTYTASRIGLGGVEDLGSGLTAGFYMESRFNADTGTQLNATKFWNAGAQVYLADKTWGSITLGRQYTPLFWSFLYADEAGPLRLHGWSATNAIERGATARVSAAAAPIKAAGSLDTIAGGVYQLGIGSTFEDNLIVYKSPELAGTTVRLAAGAPEGSPAGGGRILSGSAEYRGGPFFGSVAYNQKRGTVPASGGADQTLTDTLVSAMYDIVPNTFKVWGNVHPWKLEDPGIDLKGRDWMLGMSYWFGASQVWLNYSAKKIDNCVDCDSNGFGVGYHYLLSKRTGLYAAAAQVRNAANAANALNGIAPGTPGKNLTAFTVGLATTF